MQLRGRGGPQARWGSVGDSQCEHLGVPPHLWVGDPFPGSQLPVRHSLHVPESFFIPGQQLSPSSSWAPGTHPLLGEGLGVTPEPSAASGGGRAVQTEFKSAVHGVLWELEAWHVQSGSAFAVFLWVSSEDGDDWEFLAP
ncbi:hypothetical protein HJG60_007852 [Phyllostomus discolor]|uniref:Uncharacterized protein n=1 Tax=Phyllostomus discolor TaxID=89673 RepID=A0A834BMR8_9CHIR|nr:hypothetical protein HJG60_007852 [Phyllostomus discolor]